MSEIVLAKDRDELEALARELDGPERDEPGPEWLAYPIQLRVALDVLFRTEPTDLERELALYVVGLVRLGEIHDELIRRAYNGIATDNLWGKYGWMQDVEFHGIVDDEAAP